MVKRYIRAIVFLAAFSGLLFSQRSAKALHMPAQTGSQEALVLFSAETATEMQQARDYLEDAGAKIKCIFPPKALIADIPLAVASAPASFPYIKAVLYGKADPQRYPQDPVSAGAIDSWNRMLEFKAQPPQRSGENEALLKKEDSIIEVDFPEDLFFTKSQKARRAQQYLRRFQLAKTGARGGESALPFGKALGAGYYDTSLYLSGDIAIGIFFADSKTAQWTTQEMNSAYAKINAAILAISNVEPLAKLTFFVVKEVNESGIPLPVPESLEQRRDYVNSLRSRFSTHWVFMLVADRGSKRTTADYFGPQARIYYGILQSDNWSVQCNFFRSIFTIFGAIPNQYTEPSATQRSGYLNVVNANSPHRDGKGFYAGVGEGDELEVMANSNNLKSVHIGTYTRGQVGWWDDDEDGILDPLDTYPAISSLSKNNQNPYVYTGRVADTPLKNDCPAELGFSDVSINTIVSVEYRMDAGGWREATAQDGSFDSGVEDFTFGLPPLPQGTYRIEVRAQNSAGNTGRLPVADTLMAGESDIVNAPAMASFSFTPSSEGGTTHQFLFDAGASSDKEDDPSLLEVRWDFENDGIWDKDFSTTKVTSFRYASSGTKTVVCEVRDTQGAGTIAVKAISVKSGDRDPQARFKVTPHNYYGSENNFVVELNPAASSDDGGSGNLRGRWDFENDGKWDTQIGPLVPISTAYPLPKSLPTAICSQVENVEKVIIVDNYLYLNGGGSSFEIYDMSGPELVRLGKIYPTIINDFIIEGKYAYVAAGSRGLSIIDISNPTNPVLAGSCDTPGLALAITKKGDYVYVADHSEGIQIINITNPSTPVVVKNYSVAGSCFQVLVNGDLLLTDDYGTTQLVALDITNPLNPVARGKIKVGSMITGIAVKEQHAYVCVGNFGLRIIDISNPSALVEKGRLLVNTGFTDDVFLSGNYAYIPCSNDYGGLRIVDISDPAAPKLAYSYAVPGQAKSIFVLGNKAYISYAFLGLRIVDVSEPFTEEVASFSKVWQPRLEVIDNADNRSEATRVVSAITYNHPPTIEKVAFSKQGVNGSPDSIIAQAIGADDPDLNTTWDGLLEYRWDFDQDGNWDTRFSSESSIVVPAGFSQGSSVVCQVQDRFGARCQAQAVLDTVPPSGSFKINNGSAYVSSAWVRLTFNTTDAASGMGEGALVALSNDGINWTEFAYAFWLRWELSRGEGEKSVYAKFRDAAGNWSGPYSVKVWRDFTLPVISLAQEKYIPKGYFKEISAKIVDSGGSGIKKASLYWYGYNRPHWSHEEIPLDPNPGNIFYARIPYRRWVGSYRYCVVAWDNAGNLAYSRTYQHPPVD